MAAMGFRTIDEMVGRSQMLDQKQADRALEGQGPRLLKLFFKPKAEKGVKLFHSEVAGPSPRRRCWTAR